MKINTQHGWSFTVWDDQLKLEHCPTCHVCGADTVHNALGEIEYIECTGCDNQIERIGVEVHHNFIVYRLFDGELTVEVIPESV